MESQSNNYGIDEARISRGQTEGSGAPLISELLQGIEHTVGFLDMGQATAMATETETVTPSHVCAFQKAYEYRAGQSKVTSKLTNLFTKKAKGRRPDHSR